MSENPSDGGHRGSIAMLRIMIWLTPGIMLPIGFATAGNLGWFNSTTADRDWAILLAMLVAACIGLGVLDARLALRQKLVIPPLVRSEMIRRTILYCLLQILIAPAIGFTAFFGYCLLNM